MRSHCATRARPGSGRSMVGRRACRKPRTRGVLGRVHLFGAAGQTQLRLAPFSRGPGREGEGSAKSSGVHAWVSMRGSCALQLKRAITDSTCRCREAMPLIRSLSFGRKARDSTHQARSALTSCLAKAYAQTTPTASFRWIHAHPLSARICRACRGGPVGTSPL